MNELYNLKAKLLSGAYLKISDVILESNDLKNETIINMVQSDNLYQHPWIFLKLSHSCHVRMVILPESAPFILSKGKSSKYFNVEDSFTGEIIARDIMIEDVFFHSPGQLFYSLYESCSVDCKFCPLSLTDEAKGDSLSLMLSHIDKYGVENIDSIGITSGIPSGKTPENVALEIASVVKSLRKKIGMAIPIGVSPKQATKENLKKLKSAGANEVRLNIETFDKRLAKLIIPNKLPQKTLESIKHATEIFGAGKVSSNIILGIGEADESVLECITELASIGAIATLYPYDSIPERDVELKQISGDLFGRPSSDRLIKLLFEHKRILSDFHLDPNGLETMCPKCAASHMMPGKDL